MSDKIQLLNLPYEILNNIFKQIKILNNVIIICKFISLLVKNHQFKSDWIIYHYGKAHALFYAIGLGPSFIDIDTVKVIIQKKGILSRYFIQRLCLAFGKYDMNLIDQKINHVIDDINGNKLLLLQKKTIPWASDLPIPSLVNCLFVSREWCRITIPILWQNPFKSNNFTIKSKSLKQIIHNNLNANEAHDSNDEYQVKYTSLFPYLSYVKEIHSCKIMKMFKKYTLITKIVSLLLRSSNIINYICLINNYNFPCLNNYMKNHRDVKIPDSFFNDILHLKSLKLINIRKYSKYGTKYYLIEMNPYYSYDLPTSIPFMILYEKQQTCERSIYINSLQLFGEYIYPESYLCESVQGVIINFQERKMELKICNDIFCLKEKYMVKYEFVTKEKYYNTRECDQQLCQNYNFMEYFCSINNCKDPYCKGYLHLHKLLMNNLQENYQSINQLNEFHLNELTLLEKIQDVFEHLKIIILYIEDEIEQEAKKSNITITTLYKNNKCLALIKIAKVIYENWTSKTPEKYLEEQNRDPSYINTLEEIISDLSNSAQEYEDLALIELKIINNLPHDDVVSKQYQMIQKTIPELEKVINEYDLIKDENVNIHFNNIDNLTRDDIHSFNQNILKEINRPLPFPFIGNIISFNKDAKQMVGIMRKKYGDIYEIYFANQRIIIISNPEYIEKVFNSNSNTFSKRFPKNLYNESIKEFGLSGIALNDDIQKWKYNQIRDYIINDIDNIIENRRKEIKNKIGDERCDMLTTLIMDNKSMTNKEIIGIIYDTFIPGTETVKKMLKEIKSVFPENINNLNSSNFSKLKYCEAIIKEASRVSPTANIIPRCSENQCEVAGYEWNSETFFMIDMDGFNYNKWSSDPKNFDPERFYNMDENINKDSMFGGGVRICPGKKLGLYEIYFLLIALFGKYDIELVNDKLPLKLKTSLSAGDFSSAVIPPILMALGAFYIHLIETNDNKYFIILRIFKVIIFYINYILYFDWYTQIHSNDEDKINKPSRPIPSGLVTIEEAKIRLMIISIIYPIISYMNGGIFSILICLKWELWIMAYEKFELMKNPFLKNLFSTFGNILQICNNYYIITGINPDMNELFYNKSRLFELCIYFFVMTTIQMQDFRDQKGDKFIGRKTFPLVLGDEKYMNLF
ncbi:8818_t:CDS:10 [Cetraspora pellucida]|uniref:8818_t:CDS:1 n=1 Tax=Cetraspora pellucida TaxID=1433469 RepID=A0A9N8VAW0_9GLOM|nr:8818_t:CDS:10 [Cetraspora pellucida]